MAATWRASRYGSFPVYQFHHARGRLGGGPTKISAAAGNIWMAKLDGMP